MHLTGMHRRAARMRQASRVASALGFLVVGAMSAAVGSAVAGATSPAGAAAPSGQIGGSGSPSSAPTMSNTVEVPCKGPGGGVTGLVDAINAANAGKVDAINLAKGCTYRLKTPNTGDDGLPVITASLLINGRGAAVVRSTQRGTPTFRLLEVGSGGALELEHLRLSGGSAEFSGGAILDTAGSLTVRNAELSRNHAEAGGGAIESDAAGQVVRLTHVKVEDNSAAGGGGVAATEGTLAIRCTEITGNRATGIGLTRGGGLFVGTNATADLSQVSVSGNRVLSAGSGGGVLNFGTLTADSTSIAKNSVVPGPDQFAQGGGLQNTGTATLTATQIVHNRTKGGTPLAGGGVFNSGSLTLTRALLSHNKAQVPQSSADGGGLANASSGKAVIQDTTIDRNHALGPEALGGGIFNDGGSVGLMDSSVLKNKPDNCAPSGSVSGCSD